MNKSKLSVSHYWFNRLFCWHNKKHRRMDYTVNAMTIYCGVCYRKRICIADHSGGGFNQ